VNPVVVPSNRPPNRFYRGGRRITEFRGEPPAGEHEPEDWIGSTTAVFGQAPVGMTVLPGGQMLADLVAAHPEAWLGPAHVAAHGADTKLLVKLLDPGQRLPVHAHPDGAFAREHVGCAHGKAEAWFVLRGGAVHVGLRRDVTHQHLRDLVARQDVDGLVGLLHRVTVQPGDVVYVPPGVLHAIGEGVFLLEIQEPEDLSILLEWRDFDLDGERDGHLGLGFDVALQAVERRARSPEEIGGLIRAAGWGASVLPAGADPYFRLERWAITGTAVVDAGFAVLVATEGTIRSRDPDLDLARGTTALLPHAAGPLTIEGRGELLVCRPPRP
jgi:mannose-6-phosphate isomerase